MRFSFTAKVVLLGLVFTLIPPLLLLFLILYQSNQILQSVLEETQRLSSADLQHITESVYNLCETQQEVLQSYIDKSLDVANHLIQTAGGVHCNTEQLLTWEGINQFTKEKFVVKLPTFFIGNTPIQQNKDPKVASPIVDEVQRLQDVTCTIFQRMNEAGDMLRICTNVLTKEGERAVGMFIPARGADGTPNAVVNTVLNGERYRGRAFVVDRWYVTAYDPLRDPQGNIVGMIYTGIPQEKATALRKGIMDIVIGKTGYVFVLNGKGDNRGYCVISYKGTRDGKNEWELKDAEGRYFIQEIINKALSLKGKETAVHYYTWQKADDPAPRKKVAYIAYFEPWDWVIGASAYVDELIESDRKVMAIFRSQMITILLITLGVSVISILVWLLLGKRLSSQITSLTELINESVGQVESASKHLANSSQEMATQVSNQASSLEETSASLEEMSSRVQESAANSDEAKNRILEIQTATEQSSQSVAELNEAMTAIRESSLQTERIIKTIEEVAFQTNLLALNAAVEAARAGEAGRGFAVVAEEVRNLAQRTAIAAKETAQLLKNSHDNVERGTAVTDKVLSTIQHITESVQKAVTLVTEISTASFEQAQGIEQINIALATVNQVTQNISAISEETASTAEQLSAQSVQLKNAVDQLYSIIKGRRSD